jgi:hypothetical protein
MDSWLGQFGTRIDNDARSLLCKRATLRVCAAGTEAPQARRRGGNLGQVGFDTRSFCPWDGRSLDAHPQKGMISSSSSSFSFSSSSSSSSSSWHAPIAPQCSKELAPQGAP